MTWERIQLSEGTAKYLRGEYEMWSKMSAGEPIFVVLPKGQEPTEGNGGYRSIKSALAAKGFIE